MTTIELACLRVLLRAYPRRFREQYGTDLVDDFKNLRGRIGPLRAWFRFLGDLIPTAAAQRMRGRGSGRRSGAIAVGLAELRLSARALWKSPAYTLVAVLTIGLAIGANTAIYGVLQRLVINPFALSDQGQVVRLMLNRTEDGRFLTPPTRDLLDRLTGEATSLTGAASYYSNFKTYKAEGVSRPARTVAVSSGYRTFFGIPHFLGQDVANLTARDEGRGVVVLGHSVWKSSFGADPGVVGTLVELDGEEYEVVGIAHEDFIVPQGRFPVTPEFIFPLSEGSYAEGMARVDSEKTFEAAEAELTNIARAWAAETGNQAYSIKAFQFTSVNSSDITSVGYALMGGAALVLLIACANISSILVARSLARRREQAVRVAIGASRGRILLQSFSETLIVVGLAGIFGLLVTSWLQDWIAAISPESLGGIAYAEFDATTFGFGLGLTGFIALLVGFVPAVRATRVGPGELLRSGDRGNTGSGARFREFLIVAEVAMSFALLVAAALMFRSVGSLYEADVGFEPEGVYTTGIEAPRWRFGDMNAIDAYRAEMVNSLRALPGVLSVALTTGVPPGMGISFGVPSVGGSDPEGDTRIFAGEMVGAGYFETLNLPVLSGRGFTDDEIQSRASVVVVSESLAREFWPDESAVGKTFGLDVTTSEDLSTVVGVVGDVAANRLRDSASTALYEPYNMRFNRWEIVVRVDPQITGVVQSMNAAIREIDPEVAVASFQPLVELFRDTAESERFAMILLWVFAVVAAVISSIGLYGIISDMVLRRRRELGVRIALGAQRVQVVKAVIARGVVVTGVGVAVGIGFALGGTRFLSSLLYDVGAVDTVSFVVVGLGLLFIATIATYLPARNAAKVDPVECLREE